MYDHHRHELALEIIAASAMAAVSKAADREEAQRLIGRADALLADLQSEAAEDGNTRLIERIELTQRQLHTADKPEAVSGRPGEYRRSARRRTSPRPTARSARPVGHARRLEMRRR